MRSTPVASPTATKEAEGATLAVSMAPEETTTFTQGSLTLTRFSPNSSLFVLRGVLDADLAAAIIAEGTRISANGEAVAFHDWSGVRSYSSEARRLSTDWMLANRHNFKAVHILVASSFVAMGVQVANLVLGGFIRATSHPTIFAHELDKHRAALVQ